MIKLTNLLNEESFTAVNKATGKTSIFKSKDSRDAAVKAGTHDKKEDDGEKEQPKGEKPNMFSKDAGYDTLMQNHLNQKNQNHLTLIRMKPILKMHWREMDFLHMMVVR